MKMRLPTLLWIVSISLFALIISTFVFAWFTVTSYIRSSAFQQFASIQLNQLLRAEGKLEPISLQDTTLSSNSYVAKGNEDSAFEIIKADNIRVHFNLAAIFFRTWEIEKIQVSTLNIRLNAEPKNELDHSAITGLSSNFPIAFLLPTKLKIKEVIIEDTNLSWAMPSKDNPPTIRYGTLKQSKLSLVPKDNGSWEARGYGGKVNTPSYVTHSSLMMDYYRLLVDIPEFKIIEAKANGINGGTIFVKGDLKFSDVISANIDYTIGDFPSDDLLPNPLKDHISGTINSHGKLIHAEETLSIQGKVNLNQGYITGLPSLQKLHNLTKLHDLLRLKLDKAQLDFDYQDSENFRLENIRLESNEILKLMGSLSASSKQLNGSLDVGTTDRLLSFVPGAKSQVFTISREKYHWAAPPMTVTGTTDSFKEDLSPRLQKAFIGEIQDTVEDTVEKGAEIIKKGTESIQEVLPGIIEGFGF
ncbi:MAG: hypothetical protein AAGA18_08990 [Verrucomicrobiota bacterium]